MFELKFDSLAPLYSADMACTIQHPNNNVFQIRMIEAT